MTIFIIAVLLCLAAVAVGYALGRRQGVTSEAKAGLGVGVLRSIDKLILSSKSLPYLAQEVVNLMDTQDHLCGAALWTTDPRDQLRVLAVSKKLQRPDGLGLQILTERALTAEEIARSQSLIVQSMNSRRSLEGTRLREVDSPPLLESDADRIQEALGIKGLLVFPVLVEDRVAGALTFYSSREPKQLDEDERMMMQSITEEVGVAFENARLTNQLEYMNQRLEQNNVHLQRIDATKDEFISVASHQLRSPLTAIKGYISMLLEGDYGKLVPHQVEVLKLLSRSTNEVINLLNDMLNVSRITAQKFELTRTAARLDEIVSDVAAELQPLADEKELELAVNLPAKPLPPMYLDPMRIRQVIINFIDNAIKYTEHGKVEVHLDHDAETVSFSVTDSGIGIPEDELEKMFTKFYRAANARQVVGAGSGLGLYVAKRIIEEHSGVVVMHSVEGQGSTFGFRLPLAAVVMPDHPPQVTASV